jgi:tripartite-type tricarboxylate transporter receptor subunit TctC
MATCFFGTRIAATDNVFPAVEPPAALQPFLQSNTLSPLAVSGAAWLPAFPNMPTFAELG